LGGDEMSDPFSIEAVVLCDIIRQENNGKFILIGVYGKDIGVAGFPSNLRVSWFITIEYLKLGKSISYFQVTGPNNSTLISGNFEIDAKEQGKAGIVRLDNMPLQLQSGGPISFQLRFDPNEEWRTIKKIDVALRKSKARFSISMASRASERQASQSPSDA
jgi:hypothetical protein